MQFHFQWDPAQIDSVTPAQISSTLTDIVAFFRYAREKYASKLVELEKDISYIQFQLRNLEQDKQSKTPLLLLIGSTISFLLGFVLRYITQNTVDFDIGGLLILLFNILVFPLFALASIMLIAFLFTGIRTLCARISYPAKHGQLIERLEQSQQAYKQLDSEMSAWVARNRECVEKARTLLPDYYEKEDVLLGMIHILNNHRAATLGDALTLYLSDKQVTRQNELLAENVAAQNRAAAAASRAATAAESAAASASIAATNTTYLRNK